MTGDNPTSQGSEWSEELFQELAKLDDDLTAKLGGDGERPEWAMNALLEFTRALCPTVELKKGMQITPEVLGGILGQMKAHLHTLAEAANLKGKDRKPFREFSARMKKAGVQLSRDQSDAVDQHLHDFEKLSKTALASATNLPHGVGAPFLKAFTEGFQNKLPPVGPINAGPPAFRTYQLIALHWRVVEKCSSVRELHVLLCKHLTVAGAGNLKRTEKVCQRIGLRFRGRGRPVKDPR